MDMFEEMDKMLGGSLAGGKMALGFMPPVDISQTDGNIIVKVALPGIDPEKEVTIRIENDVLTIDGEVKRETEVEEAKYHRREMLSGKFHRALAMPAAVDGDKASSVYKNGILEITIPKRAEVQPKSVKITVKN
jgi:HSP20 family protein